MSSDDRFVALDPVFNGREPDLKTFSRRFDDVRLAHRHLRRLGPSNIAYSGGSPAELVVLVVSLAANMVAIADILAKRLAEGHDSIIRVGKKEIRLQGRWKPKDIVRVVTAISTPIGKQDASKQMKQIMSARITETRSELVTLERTIREYEKLVQGFNDIPKKTGWQKKRAKDYRKKLTELRKERHQLASFIDFLDQEY
jgi:hypothetical protein